ncbi:MAG: PAS domain-containing sensor histidine kinase [Lutibacter sp.]|nr:PAS domain-containing sensor histidine kinase [Lutibacter sp.]
MTKINEPNEELRIEFHALQQRHNSLKALYSKQLHKRKILQELSQQSEEKLKETNALLKIVNEKTKIGGWVRNLRKKQAYWSDGVTDIFELPLGYKPCLDESINFYAPEWRDKIKESLKNCEQEGISFDEEMEIITTTGKQIWVRVIGEAIKDDDGKIFKVNGSFQDISDRKSSEVQLRKLSMAVEQSPVSIFLTDTEGNIEYVNPKVIEITGYTTAELIGKNPKIFSAELTPKSVYKKLWTTISSGKEWHGEFHNKRKNGEFYWELASISPIFNEIGKITNYLAVKEDITEQKQKVADLIVANEELAFQNKEKEKRASELVIANKELAFQNEEKEKRAAELIVANKELAFQNCEKEKRASELVIANKELAFQNEDKEKRAAELVVANKELAFQNCEKEKRAAELIVAKERAEESDRLKSAFLANMSHEIRTPMNSILGFSGLLKEQGLTGEKQQKYLKIIEKSGARMLNIINDIVDISKIESGLMEVYIKETNINEKIDHIYNFFKPEAEAKNLQFSIKGILPKKEAIIKTDSEKINAILSNLVKNAIKYTNKGTIECGYENKGEFLKFYIKDTGMGIPKNRQKAIFERFIQADISDTLALQGAGLGLSIAKAYVELLGGKIWVNSEVGIGSTFYFTIPCKWESN